MISFLVLVSSADDVPDFEDSFQPAHSENALER